MRDTHLIGIDMMSYRLVAEWNLHKCISKCPGEPKHSPSTSRFLSSNFRNGVTNFGDIPSDIPQWFRESIR